MEPNGDYIQRKSEFVNICAFCLIYTIVGSWPSDHYFRSVCLFARLFVCLFVCLCRVLFSRLRSDLDQTRTHVTCLGL